MARQVTRVSDGIDPKALESLALKAYWALDQMSSDAADRFSSTAIAAHLVEVCGISTSRQAIEYGLRVDRKAVHKSVGGYKLMEHGKQLLSDRTPSAGVRVIDANSPFTAKSSSIKELLDGSYTTVALCDPYLDVNTLDVIYRNFAKGSTIRLLTMVVKDKPLGTLSRMLTDLRAEGFAIEVRVYSASALHDRYIITDRDFLLSGNSLNYLGHKQSFLVRLSDDIRQSMLATFNTHWKGAVPFV